MALLELRLGRPHQERGRRPSPSGRPSASDCPERRSPARRWSAAAASRGSGSRSTGCSAAPAASSRPGTPSAARPAAASGNRSAANRRRPRRHDAPWSSATGRAEAHCCSPRAPRSRSHRGSGSGRTEAPCGSPASPVSGFVDGTSVCPLVGDRLHLGLVVAERFEVAERDQAQAVAGRADFLVDLEAALKLLVGRTCPAARRSRAPDASDACGTPPRPSASAGS